MAEIFVTPEIAEEMIRKKEYSALRRILCTVPAADVAPVVHSTWVWVPRTSHYGKKSGEWRCKRCRAIAHGGLSPYCSKCGAKMKLEEDACDPT